MKMNKNDVSIRAGRATLFFPMLLRKRAVAFASVLATAHPSLSCADGLYQWEQYGSYVTSAQKISALSDDAFGDHVSLFTGSVGFSVTDISVPGNSNLPVALARRFTIESRDQGRTVAIRNLEGFFDWDVEVPYLEGTFSETYGWQTRQGGAPTPNRCSTGGRPYVGSVPVGTDEKVWSGYNVHIPGGTDGKLLSAIYPGAYSSPTDGYTYPWVTRSNMRLRCLASTANGYPGEAFVGVAPDGTRYYFNWGIERTAPMLKVPEVRPISFVRRKRVYLLATRIEDRFGNWVNFSYSGDQLTSITANDDRSITVNWTNGRITSATTNGRIWTYQYQENVTGTDGGLSAVMLPDGSRWSYAKTGQLWTRASVDPPEGDECSVWAGSSRGPFTYSVTHPSGAVAVFNFTQKLIYRVAQPSSCLGVQPSYYDVWGLNSKTVSGPGVAAQTTSYNIESGPTGAASSKWTTVMRPDGTQLRFRHGTDYYTNEGKVLQEQTLTSTGTIVKDRSISYVAESEVGPFPANIGQSPHTWQADEARVRPVKATSITQDFSGFNMSVNSFDALARPLSVTRGNSSFSRTDITAYEDNTNRWVLGLITSVVNVETGLTSSATTYDPTMAVPTDIYAFGDRKQELGYNADGTVDTITEPGNRVITLSDWKRGIPQSILHPDGSFQSAVVTDDGWIDSVTDENGFTTSYDYDEVGRLTGIHYPSDDTVAWTPLSISYSKLATPEGQLDAGTWVQQVSLGRSVNFYYYDALWRKVFVAERDAATAAGIYTRTTYDHAGRVAFQSYPSSVRLDTSAGVTNTYDALGRLEERRTTGGIVLEATDYLPGNRKEVTDADGKVTTISYQAFDVPDYSNAVRIDAEENQRTDIARNVFGRIQTITQSGSWSGGTASATRTLQYDSYQRLCRRIDPESGSTVWGYNAAGHIAWEAKGQTGTGCLSTAPSGATSFGYDARGRKKLDDYPGTSEDVSYGYDDAGNLTSVTNAATSWTYTYNKRNLIEREEAKMGSLVWALDPIYNTLGQVAQEHWLDDSVIEYAPDAWGRPTQLTHFATNFVTNIQYHPNGIPSSYTLGNGLTYTQTLDNLQRPYVQETKDGGTSLQRFVYGYSNAGDLLSIDDQVIGANDLTATYDDLHRLESATGVWGSYGYVYDTLNNIRSRTGPNSLTYSYNSINRLSGISGSQSRTYGYNARGEITGDGLKTFTVNSQGQITSISGTATYSYDGNGRRMKKYTNAGGVTEYALYDHSGRLLQTWNPTQLVWTNFFSLNGQPIVEEAVDYNTVVRTARYLHADLLGSPRMATSATKSVLWYEHFDPYGKKLNGVSEKIGYTGHAHDSETGYTYMQARFYDAQVGRFLSTDPIHFVDANPFTFNRYSYANNNPYAYVDPDGRCTGSIIKKGDGSCPFVGRLLSTGDERRSSVSTVDGSWANPASWMMRFDDFISSPEVVDFSAGLGDAILFNQGDRIRGWLDIDGGIDYTSGAYTAGTWTGVGVTTLTGGAAGLRLAGTASRGLEFSHWIPARWGGARNLWNGNYVTTIKHALSDPFRYRFMPRTWKALNPLPSTLTQQWNRIPYLWKGLVGGSAYGSVTLLDGEEEE